MRCKSRFTTDIGSSTLKRYIMAMMLETRRIQSGSASMELVELGHHLIAEGEWVVGGAIQCVCVRLLSEAAPQLCVL